MIHQVRTKSKSGSTIFTDSIHFDILNAKTYAASVLLKNYYAERDETNLHSIAARMRMIGFSRKFLTKKKKECGSLICTYCHRPNLIIELEGMHVPNPSKATIDHITPISKGGDLFDPKNINVACGKCNSKKSDMPLEAFLAIVKPWEATEEGVKKKKKRKKRKKRSTQLVAQIFEFVKIN